MGLRCSTKGVTILFKLSALPVFWASFGLWCFEGHFQEAACAPGDQTHFSCSCTTNATANGQNSVPAGPLGLLPSSLVPESLPKAFSNVHRNVCNLRVRCESEMQFLWTVQLLILPWMDSMFWSVWSREDHSRAFISAVGWSLWCHGMYDKRKCSPEQILLFLFLLCNLLICINFLSVQSIIC